LDSTFTGPFSPAGEGAFTTWWDNINIYIEQQYPQVWAYGSSFAQLNLSNWALVGVAILDSTYNTTVFPSLSYSLGIVEGAFTYGQYMYVITQNEAVAGRYQVSQINLRNNEIVPLAVLGSGGGAVVGAGGVITGTNYTLAYANGAVFDNTFFGGTGPAQFVFTSLGGTFTMAATNPNTNIVPADTVYDNTGTVSGQPWESITVGATTSYIWIPSPTDTSIVVDGSTTYLATTAVNGQLSFSLAAGTHTLVLNGSANTVVNGQILTQANFWAPVLYSSVAGALDYGEKPVWVDYSTGSIQAIYASTSDATNGGLSTIHCSKITASTAVRDTWATNNTTPLNMTSSSIANIATFNLWYPVNNNEAVLLFQYNPINKRIYVITRNLCMLHIFKITSGGNNFATFFNTAGRESNLAYVKSLAVTEGNTGVGNFNRYHFTVEFDPISGNEQCIVLQRAGDNNIGAVSRIPWVE
jgi:hypothetical protein